MDELDLLRFSFELSAPLLLLLLVLLIDEEFVDGNAREGTTLRELERESEMITERNFVSDRKQQ